MPEMAREVPVHMPAHGQPIGFDVLCQGADQERCIAFIDDGGDGLAGLWPHADALTPTDHAVGSFDPNQHRTTDGAEIVGIRVGDGNGFYGRDLDGAPSSGYLY